MSHWQPERLREKMAWSTSRIATVRGRPTVLTGIRGWMISHGSSVRSEGSGLRIVACPCVSVSCGPPGKIIVSVVPKIGCRNEGLRSMDASSPRIMTFGDTAITGGSHAPTPSYPRPQAGLPPRRAASASPPPVQGLQAQDLGPDPLGAVAGRRRPDYLAVRRLRTARRRPLRRDGAQGAAGHPARLRHLATPAQRRAGRAPAQDAPQTAPAAGHRPDVDPLPRQTVPRPRRDLSRPGQGRHQPLPCLCHRLRRPQGAAVHRRPDRGEQGRGPQGRGPTLAPPSGARRPPAPVAPAGSRLLQRGGDPLPPSGAVSIPDAGGLSRPLPQAAWWSDRQLRLPDVVRPQNRTRCIMNLEFRKETHP